MKYYLNIILYLIIITTIVNCSSDNVENVYEIKTIIDKNNIYIEDTIVYNEVSDKNIDTLCELETYLKTKGLVDVRVLDSSIMVSLKYSTEDNFMNKNMYGCLKKCFLQPDVAEKVAKAQKLLKEINSNLTLLIYDGVRPRSVQQYMWDILDLPLNEKVKFVSNPKRGSLHNFGAAVDITIYNLETKKPLDMGTPYDFIGVKAWPIKEKKLLKEGVITQKHIYNRKLLRKVMTKAKFFNIQTEWWHFNSCYRKEAYKIYKIIE